MCKNYIYCFMGISYLVSNIWWTRKYLRISTCYFGTYHISRYSASSWNVWKYLFSISFKVSVCLFVYMYMRLYIHIIWMCVCVSRSSLNSISNVALLFLVWKLQTDCSLAANINQQNLNRSDYDAYYDATTG